MSQPDQGAGAPCRYVYRLKPGMGAVYDERHRAVWPELVALLDEAGIFDYQIWRHEEIVVCRMRIRRGFREAVAITDASAVQQRWTAALAGVFEAIADSAGQPLWLTEVFAHREEDASR